MRTQIQECVALFGMSKAKNLTPKYVALGLTLYQATRSSNFVELFHTVGHTVGMDIITRIDTTMTNGILTKYEENGYVYIPNGIIPHAPGRVILASCDNIDVLEETIDGKNTFHCTQMMLWQRGPSPERSDDDRTVGRTKALQRETIEKLHTLDHAKLPTGTRPSPVFNSENTIDVEGLFAESDERAKAKCKNYVQVLSRIYNDAKQNMPSWSFNEATSTITTPGMLPILQAPADDNDSDYRNNSLCEHNRGPWSEAHGDSSRRTFV